MIKSRLNRIRSAAKLRNSSFRLQSNFRIFTPQGNFKDNPSIQYLCFCIAHWFMGCVFLDNGFFESLFWDAFLRAELSFIRLCFGQKSTNRSLTLGRYVDKVTSKILKKIWKKLKHKDLQRRWFSLHYKNNLLWKYVTSTKARTEKAFVKVNSFWMNAHLHLHINYKLKYIAVCNVDESNSIFTSGAADAPCKSNKIMYL